MPLQDVDPVVEHDQEHEASEEAEMNELEARLIGLKLPSAPTHSPYETEQDVASETQLEQLMTT